MRTVAEHLAQGLLVVAPVDPLAECGRNLPDLEQARAAPVAEAATAIAARRREDLRGSARPELAQPGAVPLAGPREGREPESSPRNRMPWGSSKKGPGLPMLRRSSPTAPCNRETSRMDREIVLGLRREIRAAFEAVDHASCSRPA